MSYVGYIERKWISRVRTHDDFVVDEPASRWGQSDRAGAFRLIEPPMVLKENLRPRFDFVVVLRPTSNNDALQKPGRPFR